MNKFQARQGDIFFKSCSIPDLSKMKKKKDNILAFGEVTGHSHCVKSHEFGTYESYLNDNGDIYLYSDEKDFEIGHDEHDTIKIPKNEWICVSRQREYDPLAANQERLVKD
jgi:hypothetical protein